MSESAEPATSPAPGPREGSSARRSYREVHRRTWEMELLISGAVLFALLQLPGEVDRWYRHTDPLLAGAADLTAYLLYYYLKLILYTVISALTLHLAVRAYWVGLIGLNSVFPRGIRWDDAPMGPAQRSVMKEKAPSLRAMIRAADALASVIFSAAFALVWVFVLSVIMAGVAGTLALAISILLFDGERFGLILSVVGLVVFGVSGGVAILDRVLRERVDPERGLGKVFRRFLAFSWYAFLQPFYAPITSILMSNLRSGVVVGVMWGWLLALGGVFTVKDILLPRGIFRVGVGGFVPDVPAEYGQPDSYYVDRRGDPWFRPEDPTIPAQVVDGPFLRLHVPYRPEGDPEALAETCPDLEPLAPTRLRIVRRRTGIPEDEHVERALECLSDLWLITLNGEPLEGLDFRYGQRRGTDLWGLVAFIPTAELPEGANLLVLERVDPEGEEGEDGDEGEDEPPLRHHIPFWVW